MIYIIVFGLVLISVIIACIFKHRKMKQRWKSFEREVKYDLSKF